MQCSFLKILHVILKLLSFIFRIMGSNVRQFRPPSKDGMIDTFMLAFGHTIPIYCNVSHESLDVSELK